MLGTRSLFLSGRLLLSLSLSTLLPDALVTGLAAGVPQTAVCSLLTLGKVVALDLSNGFLDSGVLDGQERANVCGVALGLALSGEGSLGGVDLVSGRVELLELTALAGEEDQASLVVLEAGDIGDERLL